MEDEEGAEYGKADFVLLDQVTMEDFMENLKLRWAPRPAPCSLGTEKEGEERHSSHPGPCLGLGHCRGTWQPSKTDPLGPDGWPVLAPIP